MNSRAIKKAAWLSLFLPSALLLAACSVKAQLSRYPGLEQRVTEYYQAEQRSDWERMYEMHTPDFRNTVPKGIYLASMRKDSIGWTLKEFKIKSIARRHGRVYVLIHFVEKPPANSFYVKALRRTLPPNAGPITQFTVDEHSIWVQIDGKWYCHGGALQLHLGAEEPVS